MSLAYLILCAHTADTNRQRLSVCYCREIPRLAPTFSPCLCCFAKAIKVGHITLKGNFQHDWSYSFLYYLSFSYLLHFFSFCHAYICTSLITVVFNGEWLEMNRLIAKVYFHCSSGSWFSLLLYQIKLYCLLNVSKYAAGGEVLAFGWTLVKFGVRGIHILLQHFWRCILMWNGKVSFCMWIALY